MYTRIVFSIAACIALLVDASIVEAARFNVTTTMDGAAGSLRAAIIAANASPGADTIVVPAGTYTLSLAGAGEDLAATGDLDVTDHVTIVGAGAGATVIDGGGLDRVFQVISAKHVAISGVTIQGGFADLGGGIDAYDSNLTIDGSTISGNWGYGGGGIYVDAGSLTVIGSSICDNAGGGGGGIGAGNGALLTVVESTISGNSAWDSGSGILAVVASVTVRDSTISGNSADGFGGGIYAEQATVSVEHSAISGNSAGWGGGGGIFANYGTHLTVDHSTISGNSADFGGGIYAQYATVVIDHSTLNDPLGGGIVNESSTIHLKQTVVDGVFYLDQDYA